MALIIYFFNAVVFYRRVGFCLINLLEFLSKDTYTIVDTYTGGIAATTSPENQKPCLRIILTGTGFAQFTLYICKPLTDGIPPYFCPPLGPPNS